MTAEGCGSEAEPGARPGLWNCVFDHESGGKGAPEGPEGRTPGPATLRAPRWLQFTLIHLMFKCENSYAIVSGGFFTFLIKLVLIDKPLSSCCHLCSGEG